MPANGWKEQRGKDPIDIGQRPATDQGYGSAAARLQQGQGAADAVTYHHFGRRRRDVEEGPVDVEQERELGKISARNRCEPTGRHRAKHLWQHVGTSGRRLEVHITARRGWWA